MSRSQASTGPSRAHPDEPPALPTYQGLIADGWRPTAFREFVVKLVGSCNLACDYCYVYTMADQSWSTRPRLMAPATVERIAQRIAEHVASHRLDRVRVILHGGEPLLAGSRRIGELAQRMRALVSTDVELQVQTNGVRLDQQMVATLREHRIRVGISLDGDQASHDVHRRDHHGQGSYERVARTIRLLGEEANRDIFAGLLCTVDLNSDPIDTYQAMLSFAPPAVDFLLPHGNWQSRPPGRPPEESLTAYGDWLIAVFDGWYGAPTQATSVRLFEDILDASLGGATHGEQIGLSPTAFLVIDTDGTIQQVDALKSAYAGAAETGLNVFAHSFDQALRHPSIVARQIGVRALSDECVSCKIVDICGGGHYAHRYATGTGFRSRSVYCPDLLRLITYVSQRVNRDLLALTSNR